MKLFGEKSSSEGIAKAVSTAKCKIEKTAKFYSVYQNANEKHFAPELKRSIADRSPSQTAVSPSVLPDLKQMHLESKSSSTNLPV